MEELIKFIIQSIVENKDAVAVSTREEDTAVVIEASVAEGDYGKIIGKNGKIAHAIRTILHSASHGEQKKYIFKIK